MEQVGCEVVVGNAQLFFARCVCVCVCVRSVVCAGVGFVGLLFACLLV